MKPILFNTKMVQAIMEGRKTVTRRLVKPQPEKNAVISEHYREFFHTICDENGKWWKGEGVKPPCSYGDILYVRETWQKYRVKRPAKYVPDDFREIEYCYLADGELANSDGSPFKWRPSIHMPKEAARIFLRVTDVYVQRLLEMTAGDCEREGAAIINNPRIREDADSYRMFCYKQMTALWNSTIKPADLPRYGLDANPWVWVIEFERIDRPEVVDVCRQ